MWHPFRAARERRERQATGEREAFINTLAQIVETFADVQRASHETVAEMARAQTAQSDVLREHLALFKVSSPPTSRVIRDADEYQAELDRLFTGDMKKQLSYVLDQTGDPEN